MSVLKLGSSGAEVKRMQLALGISADKADGVFGPGTEKAVKAFQKANGLMEDGIVGEKTLTILYGMSKTIITEAAFLHAADKLKCEVAAIKAIAAVESSGNGFLVSGKPKILYERHWAYRLLKEKGMDVDRLARFMPSLVNATAGDYLINEGSWDKHAVLSLIDEEVAHQCCSWGTFQIMGFHYKRLGHTSADAMVSEMYESADAHLVGLTVFISSDEKLLKAIRARDWASFATIYNGPKHDRYDLKMADAYKRYA